MSVDPDFSSWSLSLEDVARNRWGTSFRPRLEGLAFAPKLVREPRAYDNTPAVMLVASSASALLHRPLFDAVELMEKATGAFKVVVFTDSPTSGALRDYDWAVEHCMTEPAWETVSANNWLEMSGRRLIWASRMYKPALVIGAGDEKTAVSEIRRLGTAFSIDKAVLEGAVSHLRVGLKALPINDHPTLRGWMESTAVGQESSHRILSTDYDQVGLNIARRRGRITLITEDPEVPWNLNAAAIDHSWTVVSASEIGLLEPPMRKRLLLTVSSAFKDTLTFQVKTRPEEESDVPFNSGKIVVGHGAAHFDLDIISTTNKYSLSVEALTEKLIGYSRADSIARSLL